MDGLEEIFSYYSGLKLNYHQDELVEMLREIQEHFDGISVPIQEAVSTEFNITMPVIKSIIRLYPTLHEIVTRHRITVCTGARCAGKGSGAILKALEKELRVKKGQATKDGRFLLDCQNCLKHCLTAPNIRIDEDLYTFVKPEQLPEILKKYK